MLKFNYSLTNPRKSKKGVSKVDDLCDRLIRDSQNRECRLSVINKIYRKKGHKKYRFSEDTMSQLFTSMFSDGGDSPAKTTHHPNLADIDLGNMSAAFKEEDIVKEEGSTRRGTHTSHVQKRSKQQVANIKTDSSGFAIK